MNLPLLARFLVDWASFLCLSANKVCKHGQHEQVSFATLASRFLIMFAKFYCSLQPNKSFLPNNSLAEVLLDCLKNLSLTLVNSLKTLASEHVNLLCRKISLK